MKSLRDSLRKSLAHRHMGHQMVGALALNAARTFLQEKNINPSTFGTSPYYGRTKEKIPLEGYVRFKVFFLKIGDPSLKIKIFQQKNQILREVNLALEKVGYTTRVEEIRFK